MANEVKLTLVGDEKDLERSLRRTDDNLDRTGRHVRDLDRDADRATRGINSNFSKLGGVAAAGGAAIAAGLAVGIAAFANLGKAAVDAFLESERAQFRMDFQFDQAGLSAFKQDFKAFNEELARVTPFDDDAFAQAEAILARAFGTPEEIKKYTLLAADLSSVTGRDLAQSAEAIVKASAGSTRILKDFGIDLADLADEGANTADIFAALEEKVSGAAHELGQTAPGQVDILKNKFGEIQEAIGAGLTPTIIGAGETFLGFVETAMAGAQDVGEEFGNLGLDTEELEESLGGLKTDIEQGITDAFEDLKQWVHDNRDEIQDFTEDLAYIIDVVGPTFKIFMQGMIEGWKLAALAIGGAADALAWWIENARKIPGGDFFDRITGNVPVSGQLLPIVDVGSASFKGADGTGPKSVPKMHDGGVVGGPPGSEHLRVLVSGERVLPAGAGMGVTLTINSGGSRMDDLIVEIVQRSIRDMGGNVQTAVGF